MARRGDLIIEQMVENGKCKRRVKGTPRLAHTPHLMAQQAYLLALLQIINMPTDKMRVENVGARAKLATNILTSDRCSPLALATHLM